MKSNLILTIDLLPKGAWGNNLSHILSKKDWDTLRNICYEKSKHRCAICGKEDADLDAHEEWDFNTKTKTQTLKNIIALCSACHGVKHMRNSERIGYGENAKKHFMYVNKCDDLTFAKHYAMAQALFDERNNVLRWKLKADLENFGGKGIEIIPRDIPIIINPYQNLDWETAMHVRVAGGKTPTIEAELGKGYYTVFLTDENNSSKGSKPNAVYFSSNPITFNGPPKICSIEVDNYQGTITVDSDYANKIQWISGGKIIKTKYSTVGKFSTTFSVESLEGLYIRFKLFGDAGQTCSQPFRLVKD